MQQAWAGATLPPPMEQLQKMLYFSTWKTMSILPAQAGSHSVSTHWSKPPVFKRDALARMK
jgi:hypothetical protein